MSNKYAKAFSAGFLSENPTFRLVLGMCPTLAVSTAAVNGIGMGLATTSVLLCSNIMISLLRKFIPDGIRIPAFIVIIASFVTIVDLSLKAFIPALSQSLGLYIPLIVVNCIIFGRAESFAFKNSVGLSAIDGISMGLGFTISLTIIASVREIIGAGSLFGIAIPGLSANPALLFILPPGGFLTLGLLLVVFNKLEGYIMARGKEQAA
jgi:electron transport complex protein RnfE